MIDGQVGPQTWGALGLTGQPRQPRPAPAPRPTPTPAPSPAPTPAPAPSPTLPAGHPHARREEWFFSQQRGPWNPNEDVLGNGNCGPTAVTMVAKAFGSINPAIDEADAAIEETRRRIGESQNELHGTNLAGLQRALHSYGLQAKVTSAGGTQQAYFDRVSSELAQGKLVIAHVKASYLRPNPSSGHYTVITAIQDGKVYLNDSSNKNGPMAVSLDEFWKAVKMRGTYAIIPAGPN